MILKQLCAGDKYGYEICKLIAQDSAGEFELKEATLYSSLRRMEQEHKVNAYWGDETSGGRRKYYAITEEGKNAYINNKELWETARQILEKLI
jgi:PadR family transcriptional regulator PadR